MDIPTVYFQIAGILMSGAALYWVYKKMDFLTTCKRTQGTVESVDYSTQSRVTISIGKPNNSSTQSTTEYVARISFHDHVGNQHHFIYTSHGQRMPFVTGQKINLVYNPKDIGQVYLTREFWLGPLFLGIFIVAYLWIFFGFITTETVTFKSSDSYTQTIQSSHHPLGIFASR